jgi:hypothetical protein
MSRLAYSSPRNAALLAKYFLRRLLNFFRSHIANVCGYRPMMTKRVLFKLSHIGFSSAGAAFALTNKNMVISPAISADQPVL